MAKISFTAIVAEIVGKLGGSVFQYSYGGFQLRTRTSPSNPQTQYSQLRRMDFGFLAASWRSLTSIERQTFIDNAASPAGGFNLFIQSNVNLILIGLPLVTTYVPSSVPDAMEVAIDEVNDATYVITATGAVTTVPAGTKLLVYTTDTKAQTLIFTNPSEYSPILAIDEGADMTIPTDIISYFNARFGQLTNDRYLCLKCCLIDKSNGLRGPEFITCSNTNEAMKIYSCYLTQSGTGNPAETIVKNSYSGPATWTRTGVGIYQGTLTGFSTAATSMPVIDSINNNGFTAFIHVINDNIVQIETRIAGVLSDGVLDNAKVIIFNF